MGASALLQIVQQLSINQAQARQRKRNESTSSYEQSRKVSMHSTSCCGSNISTQESLYCNIIPPSQENLYCRTFYIAPVETLIPPEGVSEDTSVYGTLDPVEEDK